MSIGKSSISRLSAKAEPRKPETPEVPAAAVAVPESEVVKKAAGRTTKKSSASAGKTASAVKTATADKAVSASKAADKAAENKKTAPASSAGSVKSYACGEKLPYWLL